MSGQSKLDTFGDAYDCFDWKVVKASLDRILHNKPDGTSYAYGHVHKVTCMLLRAFEASMVFRQLGMVFRGGPLRVAGNTPGKLPIRAKCT